MTTEDILAIKPKILSEDQRSSYFEKGYLLVESVVSKDWIERLLEVTDQMVDRSRSLTESDAIFDLEPNHSADKPRLRRLSSPVDQHPLYWEFASESVIPGIVADLVGPSVKFHHSKLNFKWALGGEEVKWHQDITFWPHTNYSPLTVGLYLHDVEDDQGPLGVLPGSHGGDLFNQYNEQNQWVGCLSDTDVGELDLDRVEYLTGPAGSITIHNCRAIHGSGVNRSTIGRPLLLNAYSSADAFPYTHDPLMSSHHGDIVRGERAQWAHHDPRPCLIPPDWSGGYTSIYALQQEESRDE